MPLSPLAAGVRPPKASRPKTRNLFPKAHALASDRTRTRGDIGIRRNPRCSGGAVSASGRLASPTESSFLPAGLSTQGRACSEWARANKWRAARAGCAAGWKRTLDEHAHHSVLHSLKSKKGTHMRRTFSPLKARPLQTLIMVRQRTEPLCASGRRRDKAKRATQSTAPASLRATRALVNSSCSADNPRNGAMPAFPKKHSTRNDSFPTGTGRTESHNQPEVRQPE